MERFWLISGVKFNLVKRCQYFIIDWPPSIVFDSFIPALMFIVFRLVKFDINRLFFGVFFNLIIVSGRKSINITDGTMHKDFIVDEWWEFQTSKSESDM
jgi:hypothetical protein